MAHVLPTSQDGNRADRAAVAASSVQHLFGHRLLRLPGTHLGAARHPRPRRPGSWFYWWQAHYLDCLVDAAWRHAETGDRASAPSLGLTAYRLLRTVRLRNVGRFPNHYYDDMAWLALAAHRLGEATTAMGLPAAAHRLTLRAQRVVRPRLESAHTEHLGGGLFWRDRHDVKNVAATGPAALYFARTGDRARARELVDWLYATLRDPHRGLFVDGIRLEADGPVVVRDVFTYNQGTVLGTLVELADEPSLERAASLVDAIGDHLTTPWAGRAVLVTHGGHDGGLFTGIACRYVALAAAHPRLPVPTRRRAAALVLATADAFWAGRATAGGVTVFPGDTAPAPPAASSPPWELSQQLQAWMTQEAASRIDALPDLVAGRPGEDPAGGAR